MNLATGAWNGGQRALRYGIVAAAAGLGLTLVGGFFDARRALYAYLVALAYWVGIAVAALILLGTLHASNARWSVVLRRFLETMPQTLALLAALFIPVLLGAGRIFIWASPPAALDEVMEHAIHHKHGYLNVPFFAIRTAFYFVSWFAVATLLRSWSLRQDETGAPALTRWQRRLGAGSLPFLALTMSFASFDWMMSLDPRFYSTIFGVYWFAGSFLCAFCILAIAGLLTRADPAGFGHHMNADHFHSVGKFMLAFVAFWAYMAFSQFMLIWIANIPEEVPWYIVRIGGGWLWVFGFLVIFKFIVPFFMLLSRDLKRDPRRLARVAVWLLFVQWVDVYWLVMPNLDPAGPRFSLWDLAAFVGLGGAAVAFTVWRMRGAPALPIRDPYLEDSLRYQPQ